MRFNFFLYTLHATRSSSHGLLPSSRFSSTPTILNYLSYTVHQCEDALSNKKNSSGLRLMIYFLSFLFLHIKSSVFVSFKWFFTSVQFRHSEKCNIKTLEEGHSKHSDWKSKAQTVFVNLIFWKDWVFFIWI